MRTLNLLPYILFLSLLATGGCDEFGASEPDAEDTGAAA